MAELCRECFINIWRPKEYEENNIIMSEDQEICESCGRFLPYVDHIKDTIKIVGWTWYDNPKYRDRHSIGKTYDMEDLSMTRNLVVEELKSRGYKFSGHYHQNGDYGVPIFSDGTLYQCSQRFWGGIMVDAYPNEIDNSDGLGYCKWAWIEPEPMKTPNPKDYTVGGE